MRNKSIADIIRNALKDKVQAKVRTKTYQFTLPSFSVNLLLIPGFLHILDFTPLPQEHPQQFFILRGMFYNLCISLSHCFSPLFQKPRRFFDNQGLAYDSCIYLPNISKKVKSGKTVRKFNLIVFDLKLRIVVKRICFFRCYYAHRCNCYNIPCRKRSCFKDHGVEERIDSVSHKSDIPAPECITLMPEVLKRGKSFA